MDLSKPYHNTLVSNRISLTNTLYEQAIVTKTVALKTPDDLQTSRPGTLLRFETLSVIK